MEKARQHPAVMSFTLDTNCVIAVDEGRPEAGAIRRLADAHACSKADIAVVAIMVSERQRHGGSLEDFRAFQERLARLNLDHLGLCNPMAYWGVCFWGHCLWSGVEQKVLEQKIHQILFPNIELSFECFCDARVIPIIHTNWNDLTHIWRNAKCDVQAIWSHINARRDVFVTSDRNFHQPAKTQPLLQLGAGRIEYPDQAAGLLE